MTAKKPAKRRSKPRRAPRAPRTSAPAVQPELRAAFEATVSGLLLAVAADPIGATVELRALGLGDDAIAALTRGADELRPSLVALAEAAR